MVTTAVSRSLMDVVDVVLTLAKTRGPHKTAESLIFFFFFSPPQTQTPPLCACLQLSGPHSEGFDQELQTVSLVLCDGVIYSPDNSLL